MLWKAVSAATVAMTISMAAIAGPAEDKALIDAAMGVDLTAVKAALKAGANPNSVSTEARPATPLNSLAMGVLINQDVEPKKVVEVAKTLFTAGAKLGPFDRGILFFPIAQGNVPLVSLLLDKGASPTAPIEGLTPAQLAMKYGQKEVYALLTKRGAVPVDNRASAQLAFVQATVNAGRTGDFRAMEAALNAGAQINGKDADGMTALIAAVRSGVYTQEAWATIQWLLDHGADPNVRGESGFRELEGIPLHIFVAMNAKSMGGAITNRPEAKDLAIAAMGALLSHGAKVSSMDSQDRTPLHWAAKADNLRAAELLMLEDARLMAKDKYGKYPLDYAESADMIRALKAYGAGEWPPRSAR